MAHRAPQCHSKTVSEARNVAVSMEGKLDDGELLTGVPTVNEVTTTDLVLSNKVISTSDLELNGKLVPAGRAIQFGVTGGLADTDYIIFMQAAGTDSTVSQTPTAEIVLSVEADSG